MSTRRNGSDKTLKTSWLAALSFRFRLIFIVLAFCLTLSLLLIYPHGWFNTNSQSPHGKATKSEPIKKVIEVMTDFVFVTDETKWIGSGRKTKRIHVVDKANQVRDQIKTESFLFAIWWEAVVRWTLFPTEDKIRLRFAICSIFAWLVCDETIIAKI